MSLFYRQGNRVSEIVCSYSSNSFETRSPYLKNLFQFSPVPCGILPHNPYFPNCTFSHRSRISYFSSENEKEAVIEG